MTGTAYRSPRAGVQQSHPPQNSLLGDKLKKQFSGRIASAALKAASDSKLLQKTRRAADPFDHTAKPRVQAPPNYAKARAQAEGRRAAKANASPRVRQMTGMAASARHSAVSADAIRAKRAAETRARVAAQAQAAARAETVRLKKQRRAREKLQEVKLEKTPVSASAVVLMVLCTLMIMVIIYSFTQIYEYTWEISALEATASSVQKKEEELRLEVEMRDDIRMIEQIATEKIGMVKSDLVEKRFVSLNDEGDRIVILTDSADALSTGETGVFSTLLSAMSDHFERVMEYLQ